MPGFNVITGNEGIMNVDNCSFDGTDRGGKMTTNGQLWIGSTSSNRANNGGHVRLGALTSPLGSVTIGYSAPNITLDIAKQDLHISPFIVSASLTNGASYTTIQAALDAANTAGGGVTYVQPGTYTENLNLYTTSQIVGAVSNSDVAGNASIVTIAGIHTPPTTGSVSISNVYLSNATDIFNSAAAGSATLILENVNINCTNGYTFNLPNWTGALAKFNVQDDSTTNGVVNNTGGAVVYIQSSNSGAGTAKTMTVSGPTVLKRSDLVCPLNCVTGATIQSDFGIHEATVTMSNNSAGSFNNVRFSTGTTPALTQSSSGVIQLYHSIIDNTNVPAISGAGAGIITYSDVIFVNNATFAGTLTLSTSSWRPYSQALAAADGTKVGTCNFDSSSFAVAATGFVTASGTGLGKTITGQSGGALSPTAGNWNIFGASAAAGTSPVVTSGAASTLTVNIQTSQALAAADATKIGLCNFDSSSFSVSATGFVTLAGGSEAVDSFSPDSGTDPVVPTAAGLINDKGSGSITTVGSLNTITTQLTGLTNHAVLVGAGTSTITKLSVGATGTVLQGATGADPAFTATPTVTSITFGSGSALANYVTAGTWTPTIDGAVSGTTTYITQTGTYTRIGNIIVVQCLLQISAATGTGDVRIGGFPFNFNGVASTASTQWGGVWTWPVGRTSLNLEGQNGTAYCNAKTSGTGVTSANMQMANAALTLAFSLVYLA